jgi:hypothetical protein
MKFDAARYHELATLAFSPTYRGYRPNVVEAPNGDGKLDAGKQFSHLALKYFDETTPAPLLEAFFHAYCDAVDAAEDFRLPQNLWPKMDACALRLLQYPVGVGSEPHTDFDLFTLNLWRSDKTALLEDTQDTLAGIHFGELWPLLVRHGIQATKHWVESRPEPQYSMVFFALPDHQVQLEDGRTVGQWLEERIARSRY